MGENVGTEELLFMMKRISLDMTARMEKCLRYKDVTGVQIYLLVYILRHHPDGTYLTELCREIGVTKPTISALIKKLREKGYLYFHEDPADVRRKKVLPTAKLRVEGEEFLEKADRMETEICSVLDDQEKAQLWRLEKKIILQFARMEHDEKSRQEVYLP